VNKRIPQAKRNNPLSPKNPRLRDLQDLFQGYRKRVIFSGEGMDVLTDKNHIDALSTFPRKSHKSQNGIKQRTDLGDFG